MLVWIIGVPLLLLAFTVFFGPPYVPTLQMQKKAALDLLDLQKGQTLLELGSGDGRVLVAAAQRGLRVVGIELSPLLVLVSWLRTRRYHKQVRIIWGNYFRVVWPPADAIFTFMIERQMGRLDEVIRGQKRPMLLASVAFKIPYKKPEREQAGVFLYRYN